MTKGMFALLLAGALMVPHVTRALGTDSTLGIRPRPAPQVNGGALQLTSCAASANRSSQVCIPT